VAVSNAVAAVCALLRANAAAAPGQIAPCAPALLTTASAEDATHLAERAASSRPGMRPLRPQSALNSSSSAAWPAVADGRHTVEKDLRRNSTRESQRARPLKLGKCFTHLSEGLETRARHAWVDIRVEWAHLHYAAVGGIRLHHEASSARGCTNRSR
jgi:hypothetical protein